VITLDLIMPGQTGWKTLQKIRSMPETADIPVIVVSFLEEQTSAVALGANEYLTKPVAKATFLKALGRHLPASGDGSVRLLVVDDDADARKLTMEVLQAAGYDTVAAPSGAEALTIMGREPVHAVILDLVMPGMSGFEVIERMRSDSRMAAIPILVLTGKDLSAEDAAALRRATHAVFLKGRDWQRDFIRALRMIRESRAVHV
jgi:CheY-like chemotaxis protein